MNTAKKVAKYLFTPRPQSPAMFAINATISVVALALWLAEMKALRVEYRDPNQETTETSDETVE